MILDLSQHIADHSEGKLSLADIDPDVEMCDHGYLDSLSYVGFLVHVEQSFGVRILDHELTGNLRTVAAIADHVARESKV